MRLRWIFCILLVTNLASAQNAPGGEYQIDPAQSKINIAVGTGGMFGFMGHPHNIAAKDFKGKVVVNTETPDVSSLEITIVADSLSEAGEFNEKELNEINTKMKTEVLEVSKFSEIAFKSKKVTVKSVKAGEYNATIDGDLTLHGVTRQISVPAVVHLSENILHTTGTFQVNREDYNIKAASAGGGTVKVGKELKVTFNITAKK